MYLYGFGNYHQTEAIKGALPTDQNSPQQCAFNLYAEQLSGTSFARPRANNLHSWLYRILPSVAQGIFHPYKHQLIQPLATDQAPNALRWGPLQDDTAQKLDFIHGLFHIASTPSAHAFHYYCNQSMYDSYFFSNDGELLVVPYEGELIFHTEFGLLTVEPGMIAVIPRGIKFKVMLSTSEAKGYVCENEAHPLTLPQLGLIGANGLANPRHFQYPEAAFVHNNAPSLLIGKHVNKLWIANSDHSPLNVVAWHGTYAPYSYDLSLFNTINTVSFDHPDPSIYTVLTSESDTPGVAHLDFVIFPPRWMVAEHTFRPPYFHRNCMSEFMGLLRGEYDAKKGGFIKGGVSIHNRMTPHGPDFASYNIASSKKLKPEYNDSLAFMFETKDIWQITEQAQRHQSRDIEYTHCWQGFEAGFNN